MAKAAIAARLVVLKNVLAFISQFLSLFSFPQACRPAAGPALPPDRKIAILAALVVAARGQWVVAQHLQMRAQTLQHGRQDNRRDEAAGVGRDAREAGGGGIENAYLVGVALGEILDAVRQRTEG